MPGHCGTAGSWTPQHLGLLWPRAIWYRSPAPALPPWQQAWQQLCRLFLDLVPLCIIFRAECELSVQAAADVSLGGQGPPAAALLSKAELHSPGVPVLWGPAVPSSTFASLHRDPQAWHPCLETPR